MMPLLGWRKNATLCALVQVQYGTESRTELVKISLSAHSVLMRNRNNKPCLKKTAMPKLAKTLLNFNRYIFSSLKNIFSTKLIFPPYYKHVAALPCAMQPEAQLMLTNSARRVQVSVEVNEPGTVLGALWLFATAFCNSNACDNVLVVWYITFILAACSSSDATGLYILRRYLFNTQSNLSITRNINSDGYQLQKSS